MRLKGTIALAILCMSTQAANAAESGFYFGLSAGQSKYDFDIEPLMPVSFGPPVPSFNPFTRLLITPAPLLNASAGGTIATAAPLDAYWLPGKDDDANAGSALVGYRIFQYAAVEVSYADLGTLHEYQAQRATTVFVIPEVRSELSTEGPAFSALGILPITDRWEIYVRGGRLFSDQKVTHKSTFGTQRTTYGSDSWVFGAGTQLDVAAHWTVRLDFQRFKDVGDGIGTADVDVLSLGVLFRL